MVITYWLTHVLTPTIVASIEARGWILHQEIGEFAAWFGKSLTIDGQVHAVRPVCVSHPSKEIHLVFHVSGKVAADAPAKNCLVEFYIHHPYNDKKLGATALNDNFQSEPTLYCSPESIDVFQQWFLSTIDSFNQWHEIMSNFYEREAQMRQVLKEATWMNAGVYRTNELMWSQGAKKKIRTKSLVEGYVRRPEIEEDVDFDKNLDLMRAHQLRFKDPSEFVKLYHQLSPLTLHYFCAWATQDEVCEQIISEWNTQTLVKLADYVGMHQELYDDPTWGQQPQWQWIQKAIHLYLSNAAERELWSNHKIYSTTKWSVNYAVEQRFFQWKAQAYPIELNHHAIIRMCDTNIRQQEKGPLFDEAMAFHIQLVIASCQADPMTFAQVKEALPRSLKDQVKGQNAYTIQLINALHLEHIDLMVDMKFNE